MAFGFLADRVYRRRQPDCSVADSLVGMMKLTTPACLLIFAGALMVAGCSGSNTVTGPGTGGSSGSGTGTSDSPITVFITNSVYSPNPLTVKTGQFVNFKNNDTIVHSATLNNGTYESGDIPALSAHDVPVGMTSTGTFAFHCRLHGETGSIVVTP
jgi:plastocyanin